MGILGTVFPRLSAGSRILTDHPDFDDLRAADENFDILRAVFPQFEAVNGPLAGSRGLGWQLLAVAVIKFEAARVVARTSAAH